MMTLRTLLAASLMGGLLATADDIVFRNGRTVADATIVAIEGGQIEFTFGEDQQTAKTALVNVAAIRKAGAAFRVTRFIEHQERKDKGRLLEIEMVSDRQRLREPVVRVFVLMEDERGERELHLYQNERVKDPTALYDLPVVDRNAWRPARFFVEVDHEAVAWHLEIWQDGEKVHDQSLGGKSFKPKWWLLEDPERTSSLDIPKSVEEVLGDAVGVRAVIRNARVRKGLDNDEVVVDCEWALETDKERIELPEATFYYVTEDETGERKLHSDRVAKDAGEEVKVQARKVVRANTIELGKDVVLAGGGATLTGDDDERTSRLIYWRFAVHVGDVDLAVRESPNTTIRRSLGDNWWKN